MNKLDAKIEAAISTSLAITEAQKLEIYILKMHQLFITGKIKQKTGLESEMNRNFIFLIGDAYHIKLSIMELSDKIEKILTETETVNPEIGE